MQRGRKSGRAREEARSLESQSFLCVWGRLAFHFFFGSRPRPLFFPSTFSMASSILLAPTPMPPACCCSGSGRAITSAATPPAPRARAASSSGRQQQQTRKRSSVVVAASSSDVEPSSPSSPSYLRPATQGIKRDASELFGDTPMVREKR
jgi:hypothetical protein